MTYAFRPVEPRDLELICRHRHAMFKASGRTDQVLAPMTEAFGAWLTPKLASGEYFGWIVEARGAPVAGLGMMVIAWPPHPSHSLDDRRGYILNVYVEPEHRGHGLAKTLMALAVAEGKRRGLAYMVLHATQMGRPMYEALGWAQTAEMAISLTSDS